MEQGVVCWWTERPAGSGETSDVVVHGGCVLAAILAIDRRASTVRGDRRHICGTQENCQEFVGDCRSVKISGGNLGYVRAVERL